MEENFIRQFFGYGTLIYGPSEAIMRSASVASSVRKPLVGKRGVTDTESLVLRQRPTGQQRTCSGGIYLSDRSRDDTARLHFLRSSGFGNGRSHCS